MGNMLISKMGQLSQINLLSSSSRYTTFRKWPFSICFWGRWSFSLDHSMSYTSPRVKKSTLLSPQGLALFDQSKKDQFLNFHFDPNIRDVRFWSKTNHSALIYFSKPHRLKQLHWLNCLVFFTWTRPGFCSPNKFKYIPLFGVE